MASDPFEYTCTLSEETLKMAMKELNEDPSTRMLEVKTLRERLLRYPGKYVKKTSRCFCLLLLYFSLSLSLFFFFCSHLLCPSLIAFLLLLLFCFALIFSMQLAEF